MAEQNKTFNDAVAESFEKLNVFTNAITKAHGQSHPEAFDVRKLFQAIQEKVNNQDSEKLDLDAEFTELRKVTNNYTIPGDVCQTFAATYRMLQEADKAYQASK